MATSWWFESRKDPRFKGSGECEGLFGVEEEVTAAILDLEKRLQTRAPDDIEYGGMKD